MPVFCVLEAKLLSKFKMHHSILLSLLTYFSVHLSTSEVVRDCQLGLCSLSKSSSQELSGLMREIQVQEIV